MEEAQQQNHETIGLDDMLVSSAHGDSVTSEVSSDFSTPTPIISPLEPYYRKSTKITTSASSGGAKNDTGTTQRRKKKTKSSSNSNSSSSSKGRRSLALDYIPESKKQQRRRYKNDHNKRNDDKYSDSENSDAVSNASSLSTFQPNYQSGDESLESSNSQPSVIAHIMSKRQQRHSSTSSISSSLQVSDTLNADNAYAIGKIHLDNGDCIKAKKCFERALRVRESDHGWNSLEVVEVHESLGDANSGLRNGMGAMKHYLTGIDILRGDAVDNNNATALSRMESKLDELIVTYEMKSCTSFKLGSTFLSHGQYVRAERCLENALRSGDGNNSSSGDKQNDDDDDGEEEEGINKAYVHKKLGDVKLALEDIGSSIQQYELCLDLLHESGEYELAADIFTLLDDLRRQKKQQDKEQQKQQREETKNTQMTEWSVVVDTKENDSIVADDATQQTTTTDNETATTIVEDNTVSATTRTTTIEQQQSSPMTTTTATTAATTKDDANNNDDENNNPMYQPNHPDEPNDFNYRRACDDIMNGNLSSATKYLLLSHDDNTKKRHAGANNAASSSQNNLDISLAFIEERLGDVAAMENDAIRGCRHYNEAWNSIVVKQQQQQERSHATTTSGVNNTTMISRNDNKIQKIISSRILAKMVELCRLAMTTTTMTASSSSSYNALMTCLEMLPVVVVVRDYVDVDHHNNIVSQMLQSAVRQYEQNANDAMIERNDISKAMMYYNAAVSVMQFYLMRVEVNRDDDDDDGSNVEKMDDDDGYHPFKVNQNDTLKVLARISDGIERQRRQQLQEASSSSSQTTKGTTISQKISQKDEITMGIILHNVGVYYDRQSMFDKAMELYNKSLEMKRKVYNTNDDNHVAIVNTMAAITHIGGKKNKKTANNDGDDKQESSEAVGRLDQYIEKLKDGQDDDDDNTKKKTTTTSSNNNNKSGNDDNSNDNNNKTKKMTKQKEDGTPLTAEKEKTSENNNNNSTSSFRQSLESMNNSSFLYLKQGNYAMAALLLEDKLKLLKTYSNIIDKNDTEYAMTHYQLGAIYTVLSRNEEAIASFNKAVKVFRYHNYIPDVVRTIQKLACLYDKLGNYKMVIDCHKQILSLKDSLDKDVAADTKNNNNNTTTVDRISTLRHLASLCFAQGSLNESLRYCESALRAIGDEDDGKGRDKIIMLNRMGVLDMMLGDHNKALMRLRRAVAADKKLPPVVVATTTNDNDDKDKKVMAVRVGYYLLNNMGNVYLAANKGRSKALACYQQALELAKNTAANAASSPSSFSRSSQTTQRRNNISHLTVTVTKGGSDDNPLVVHDSLGVCNLIDGETDVLLDVGIIHHNIGIVKLLQGEYEIAIDHFKKSLGIKKDHLTTNNPGLLGTLTNLGTCRYYVNDYDGAIESFNDALIVAEEMINDDDGNDKIGDGQQQQHQSPSHDNDLTIANLLIKRGNTYAKTKKNYSSATSDYRRALSLKEKTFKDDPNHPEVLNVRHDLSLILCKHKLFNESIALLNDVHAQTIQAFGGKNDVVEVAKVLLDRGSVYLSMGEPKRARQDCEAALKVFERNKLPESHAYMKQAKYTMDKMKRSNKMKTFYKKSRNVTRRTGLNAFSKSQRMISD